MYLSYVYRVVNNITGQFYIGSRCKNVRLKRKPTEDFWVKYFTSSKKIKELREQHGDDSFSFEILFESDDYDSVYWKEQDYIKESISNPLCINLQFQDRESGHQKFSIDGPCSEERRLAISKTKQGELNPFYGKVHSDETRQKISVAGKGRKFSDEHRKRISEATTGRSGCPGEKNGMFGRNHSEETRQKIREAALKRSAAKKLISS